MKASQLRAQYDTSYASAIRLCRVLIEKHFPTDVGVRWEPAPDLPGVILQLDNITSKWAEK